MSDGTDDPERRMTKPRMFVITWARCPDCGNTELSQDAEAIRCTKCPWAFGATLIESSALKDVAVPLMLFLTEDEAAVLHDGLKHANDCGNSRQLPTYVNHETWKLAHRLECRLRDELQRRGRLR